MDAGHFPFYIILSNYVWSILFYRNKDHHVRQIRFHVCIKMHRCKNRVCKRKTLFGQPNTIETKSRIQRKFSIHYLKYEKQNLRVLYISIELKVDLSLRFYRSLVPRYWKINFSVRVIPACLQSFACIDNLRTSQLLGVSISEFKGLKREVRGPCGSFRRLCQSGGNRNHYESQDVSRGHPNVLSRYKRETCIFDTHR